MFVVWTALLATMGLLAIIAAVWRYNRPAQKVTAKELVNQHMIFNTPTLFTPRWVNEYKLGFIPIVALRTIPDSSYHMAFRDWGFLSDPHKWEGVWDTAVAIKSMHTQVVQDDDVLFDDVWNVMTAYRAKLSAKESHRHEMFLLYLTTVYAISTPLADVEDIFYKLIALLYIPLPDTNAAASNRGSRRINYSEYVNRLHDDYRVLHGLVCEYRQNHDTTFFPDHDVPPPVETRDTSNEINVVSGKTIPQEEEEPDDASPISRPLESVV